MAYIRVFLVSNVSGDTLFYIDYGIMIAYNVLTGDFMSKKIAVLVNEDTMQRCSCGGCLKAFMNKADSFERYADEDIELLGFTHSGGDLAKKIESFKKKGVTTVHLSTCTRGKNENYESIAEQCAEAGFDVVGYTHGGAVSKDGKEAVVLSAKPVTIDQ